MRRLVMAALVCAAIGGGGWLLSLLRASRAVVVTVPLPTTAHPNASSAFQRAAGEVRQHPESAGAWGDYGMLLFAHQFDDEAVFCFQEAARLDRSAFRWPYYAGYLQERTSLHNACTAYRGAISRDPGQVPVRLRLARVLSRLGETDEAAQHLQAAERLAPNAPYVELERGRFAIIQRDFDTARSCLTSVSRTGGPYARLAYVELARVYSLQNDADEALAAYRAAMQLPEVRMPEIPDPLILAAEMHETLSKKLAQSAESLMAAGEWDRAWLALNDLARQRPESPLPRLNQARCLQMLGNPQEANVLLRGLCRQFPDDAQVKFTYALALHEAHDDEAAISAYTDVLRLMPGYASAHFNLGLIFENRGQVDLASAEYLAAVTSDPGHAPAHLALGILLHRSGQPQEDFLPHLLAAVRLAPGDPVPQQALQQALKERGTSGSGVANGDKTD